MLLLALVGDIAYGSKAYLKELAEDLEARGVIDDASAIAQADDLLDAVAATSQKTAQSFDTLPPLSSRRPERDHPPNPRVRRRDRSHEGASQG